MNTLFSSSDIFEGENYFLWFPQMFVFAFLGVLNFVLLVFDVEAYIIMCPLFFFISFTFVKLGPDKKPASSAYLKLSLLHHCYMYGLSDFR